jgi:hypothetical protein
MGRKRRAARRGRFKMPKKFRRLRLGSIAKFAASMTPLGRTALTGYSIYQRIKRARGARGLASVAEEELT